MRTRRINLATSVHDGGGVLEEGGALQEALEHPARPTDGRATSLRRRFPGGAPKPAGGRVGRAMTDEGLPAVSRMVSVLATPSDVGGAIAEALA